MMTEILDQCQDDKQQAKYERFHEYDFEGDERFQSGWRKIAPVIHRKESVHAELLKAKLFFYSRVYEEVNLESYSKWLKLNKNGITDDQKNDLEDNITDIKKNLSEEKTTTQTRFLTNPETLSDPIKTNDNLHSDAAPKQNKDDTKSSNKADVNTCVAESYRDKEIDFEDCENDNSSFSDSVRAQSTTLLNKCEASTKVCETQLTCDSCTTENRDDSLNITEETVPSTEHGEVANDSLTFSQIAEMLENGITLPGIKDLNVEPTNKDPSPSSMIRFKKPWEK